MTLKFESENAIQRTREFLIDLMRPKRTDKIPMAVRRKAHSLLKHFPFDHNILIRDDDGKFRIPKKYG